MKKELLDINAQKFLKTYQLFENIVNKCPSFDITKEYSPEELEIFDALTSRFVRLYESCIQYFKTLDSIQSINIAESFGDLISNCQKLNVIDQDEIWFEMRLTRNKISHDYLPNQLQVMLTLITTTFFNEFQKISHKL